MSTIAEMRAVDPNSLSYKALACVTLFYWTFDTDWLGVGEEAIYTDAGSSACVLVTPSDESAWEDAVRKIYCDPATRKREDVQQHYQDNPTEPDISDSEKSRRMEEIAAEYAIQKVQLRREMTIQLRQDLEGLSPEEVGEMERLKERMRLECEQDAEEEAREKERLAEERRRSVERYEEKKRRKREKRRKKKKQKYGWEGDSGESERSEDSEEDEED